MKIDWNRKYTTVAVYAVITVFAVLLLCTLFVNFSGVSSFFSALNGIMMPFYIGLGIAYIANPIMKMAEKHIFRFKVTSNRRFSVKRGLSITLALIVLLIILTILILLIIPQVILSLTDLASKMSGYIDSTVAWLDEFLPDAIFDSANLTLENFFNSIVSYFTNSSIGAELSDISEQLDLISDNLDTLITNSFTIIKDYVPVVFGAFAGVANGVFNVILGVFFAIYTLSSKEKLIAQVKKVIRAFSGDHLYNSILEFGNFTNKTFGSYLIGKVLDSFIVGIVMFIVCAIVRIPYAPLVSVLVAITNVIPIIGPFIGAIPGVLIIFIVDPSKVLAFIIINIFLQQIDGNIIVPKILGETTGLSSLWVLFSITVMGGLWGLTGMFISVPIFAILYTLFKLYIENRLRRKELPTETFEYYTDRENRAFQDNSDYTQSFAAHIKASTDSLSRQSPIRKVSEKLKSKKQNKNGKDQ